MTSNLRLGGSTWETANKRIKGISTHGNMVTTRRDQRDATHIIHIILSPSLRLEPLTCGPAMLQIYKLEKPNQTNAPNKIKTKRGGFNSPYSSSNPRFTYLKTTLNASEESNPRPAVSRIYSLLDFRYVRSALKEKSKKNHNGGFQCWRGIETGTRHSLLKPFGYLQFFVFTKCCPNFSLHSTV